MNKTDLLLQMMEQPHRYTAEEWQEILADDECREFYTLMSKTQSAVNAAHADEQITDEIINAEWQRTERADSSRHFPVFYKFAAMFIGILMLSGFAYATIYIYRHVGGDLQSPTQEKRISDSHQQALSVDTIKTDSIPTQPKLYDNVPLEQMLAELSTYYNIKVEYRTEAVRKIRLFYQWKPDYSLEKVVEMLNNFDWLQLELEDNTLFVSSSIEPQP